MAKGSLLTEYAHHTRQLTGCARLCVDVGSPADNTFLAYGGFCRCGVDAVCLRTVGSSPARDARVSKSTVQRIWSHNEIKPDRLQTFKISNDPNFEEKFWDVIGLYLYPP